MENEEKIMEQTGRPSSNGLYKKLIIAGVVCVLLYAILDGIWFAFAIGSDFSEGFFCMFGLAKALENIGFFFIALGLIIAGIWEKMLPENIRMTLIIGGSAIICFTLYSRLPNIFEMIRYW